jgi:hypothetical protein
MPYPNDLKLNVIIAQTSGSADGSGKFPFTERIISGSSLILQTDSTGTLIGSPNIALTDITASNISASGYISASNLWVKTNITDAGTLTVVGATTLADLTGTTATFSGLVSASAGLTASAIQDAGTLTVVGATTLAGLTGTTATFSGLVSASAGLTASAIHDAGTLTVVGATTLAGLTGTTATFSGLVSASAGLTASAIHDAGTLTVVGATTLAGLTGTTATFSGLVSASAGLTASAIHDAGTLTVLGNTTLGDNVSDIIKMTGSVSISGSLTIDGTLNATSSWAINALTASKVIVTDTSTGAGPYYVTFVDGTTNDRAIRTDSSTLTWNSTTNTLSSSGNFIANTVTASLSGSAIQTGNATINGGAINNTTIGFTTPSTGNFTNLSASNLLVTSSISFVELMSTGSTTSLGVNISASAITGSNTLINLVSSVSTGSSFALIINSTSGISGSAFAISASNGQIVGTLFTGSNALFTSVTASLSGSAIQTGNATINGGAINGTVIGGSTAAAGTFTNLTATGNTTLGDAVSDIIKITGSVSISGSLLATSSWATNALTSSTVLVTDTTTGTGPYYVTFVDGTSGAKTIRTDSSTLTWNATTNTLSSSGNIVATSFTSSNGIQFTNNNATISPISTGLAGYNLTVSAGDGGSTLPGGNLYLESGDSNDISGDIYINPGVATIAGTTGSVYINGGGLTVGVNSPVNINNATQATNYNDAALEVVGGVGIGKNLYVSGSTWIYGDLTLFGSSSVVYISSSTVIINDNIIQLNAYLPFERYSGFEVFDSGSSQRSASLLWDGKNDNWITIDQNNSASNIVLGPTSSFGSDNITGFTANVIPKAYDETGITDSKLTDTGTALQYTGNLISASRYYGTTGSLTYITGALVTYVTGSFTTITIATGSSPGAGDVPVHPTASGMAGQINVDNNFIYVYTNNIWKRVPISNWTP